MNIPRESVLAGCRKGRETQNRQYHERIYRLVQKHCLPFAGRVSLDALTAAILPVVRHVRQAGYRAGYRSRLSCRWTCEPSPFYEVWETGCGASWSFEDGGPVENGVKFCHGCGRSVVVKRVRS